MAASGTRRRLAAILNADVAGFSRLMGADEAGTHGRLVACRAVTDAQIACHDGRLVGTAGDSVLAEFPSVVEAVACAVDIQRVLGESNAALPSAERLELRIGINLGDVIVDGADIYGDGVNIAARLQAMATPGGITISGAVHEQVRQKLDLPFRDLGRHRVKNIAEPVHVYAIEAGATAPTRRRLPRPVLLAAALALGASLALGLWVGLPHLVGPATVPSAPPGATTAGRELGVGAPTIAVLPFANQTGDAGRDYLSDGVTEEIISSLGRFSSLKVVGRRLAFAYKGHTGDPRQLGRELHARYLVEGTVHGAGDALALAVELTDTQSGVLLWSERFDTGTTDLLAVQQAIVQRVVGALAVKLTRAEQERTQAKSTASLEAYDYLLRARHLIATRGRSANSEARGLLRQALELDPDLAAVHVELAAAYLDAASFGWREPRRELAAARATALRAIELDPGEARAHMLLGDTYASEGRWDLAGRELDRALELNPSDPEVLADHGSLAMRRGRLAAAITDMETALDIDPLLDPAWIDLSVAYWFAGRDQDAVTVLERGLAGRPDRSFAHAVLAAIHAERGEMAKAEAAARKVRRTEPFFAAENVRNFFVDTRLGERFVAALRKAGLE